ncbi:hypothetical protein [Streptomyces sparsus]
MQRKAYLGGAAVATALTLSLVGCTAGGDGGGEADDAKPGGTSASAPSAEPGTYRTLPNACEAVSEGTLRDLLTPDVDDDEEEPEGTSGTGDSALAGEAQPTYDTDRRVGCRWKSATSLGSRHLTLDFERVVSYDRAVSDDDRAAELYADRALKDGIPSEAPPTEDAGDPTDSPDASGSASGSEDTDTDDGAEKDATEQAAATAGSDNGTDADAEDADDTKDSEADADPAGAGSSADPALAPRPLEGIAAGAYLNDKLATADSGVHRDITLVFRSGNVIVTVEYDQWSNDKRRLPDSEELQQKARKLAEQLAGRLAG